MSKPNPSLPEMFTRRTTIEVACEIDPPCNWEHFRPGPVEYWIGEERVCKVAFTVERKRRERLRRIAKAPG